jgi:hypothetical protein
MRKKNVSTSSNLPVRRSNANAVPIQLNNTAATGITYSGQRDIFDVVHRLTINQIRDALDQAEQSARADINKLNESRLAPQQVIDNANIAYAREIEAIITALNAQGPTSDSGNITASQLMSATGILWKFTVRCETGRGDSYSYSKSKLTTLNANQLFVYHKATNAPLQLRIEKVFTPTIPTETADDANDTDAPERIEAAPIIIRQLVTISPQISAIWTQTMEAQVTLTEITQQKEKIAVERLGAVSQLRNTLLSDLDSNTGRVLAEIDRIIGYGEAADVPAAVVLALEWVQRVFDKYPALEIKILQPIAG